MKKKKVQNIEFIESIENAEGQPMPAIDGLDHADVDIAKVGNCCKAKNHN